MFEGWPEVDYELVACIALVMLILVGVFFALYESEKRRRDIPKWRRKWWR